MAPQKVSVEAPSYNDLATLALTVADKRIILGDNAARIAELVPRPPNSWEFRELPPMLDNEFSVRGWEDRDGGFGAILKDGRLVFAMRAYENVSPELLQEIKEACARGVARGIKPFEYGNDNMGYRFYRDGETQIMIAWAPDIRGRVGVTTAIGLMPLMTALRMDSRFALEDLAAAEEQLAKLSAQR